MQYQANVLYTLNITLIPGAILDACDNLCYDLEKIQDYFSQIHSHMCSNINNKWKLIKISNLYSDIMCKNKKEENNQQYSYAYTTCLGLTEVEVVEICFNNLEMLRTYSVYIAALLKFCVT